MAKTVTLRIDNPIYRLIASRAESERRSLSNFIEIATLAYIQEAAFVEDDEMTEILANRPLLKRLRAGSRDAKLRKGHFVG